MQILLSAFDALRYLRLTIGLGILLYWICFSGVRLFIIVKKIFARKETDMFDTKQFGKRIAFLRKQNGMSQERLAELLCISPQAISKWENGHTTPEAALLPVLAQIFQCCIDAIIMPAYLFDPEIEEKKPNKIDLQAQRIANYIMQQSGSMLHNLRKKYLPLIHERFRTGKHITVIHGDLHPGNIFLSRLPDASVKMIDMEAVRVGLCTEDLSMLLALHIEPDLECSKPLLDCYYDCLCQDVEGYSYDMFMDDYRISVAEAMFYPIRLINQGIFDFDMRDRAVRAYEAFVAGNIV